MNIGTQISLQTYRGGINKFSPPKQTLVDSSLQKQHSRAVTETKTEEEKQEEEKHDRKTWFSSDNVFSESGPKNSPTSIQRQRSRLGPT